MAKIELSNGKPVTPEHKEIDPATGQQKGYVVLTAEERAKGFVRPVRHKYVHIGVRSKYPLRDLTPEEQADPLRGGQGWVKYEEYPESESPLVGKGWTKQELRSGCGTVTAMADALAETYARDPKFYGMTFCCKCKMHFDVGQFIWDDGSSEVVGS